MQTSTLSPLYTLADEFPFKLFWSGFIGFCSWLFSGFDVVLCSLGLLWAIDFVFGFIRALKGPGISSEKMKHGVGKLLIYGVVLVVFGHIDLMLSSYFPCIHENSFFLPVAALYLATSEALSILEHAALSGWRIPAGLTRRLRKVQETLDKNGK